MQDAIILYENGKAIGGEGHPADADDITFDNAGTDLVSENVEDAIKEVNTKASTYPSLTLLATQTGGAEKSVDLSDEDCDYVIVISKNIDSQMITEIHGSLISSSYQSFLLGGYFVSNSNFGVSFSIKKTAMKLVQAYANNQADTSNWTIKVYKKK